MAVDGAEVRLTRTEYAILRLLMASPSRVITKSRLLPLFQGGVTEPVHVYSHE